MDDQLVYILASIIAFTGVICILVIGLMIASKKLNPGGIVKIDINDGKKVLDAEPGATLSPACAR